MRRRYWRLYFTLLGIILHIFWFDIIGRRWFAASAVRRWVRLAMRFRALAIALGGVPIKLGQFMSVRVDVLPQPVTTALADLRDEVPAAPFAAIEPVLAAAWGHDYREIICDLDNTVVAAASLGQVYRARRRDTGQEIAIKVLRPEIHAIIETDLAAVQAIVRLIKDYPLIQRRADMERLFAEFAEVLRQELDYRHEIRNNERLQACVRDEPRVVLPVVHHDLSTSHVLVMDWVTGIAPDKHARIDEAGIDRHAVAQTLLRVFFAQCFVHGVFHADPHPGNMLISADADGTWRIHLLDLGAVSTIPATMQVHLRKAIVAVVSNDTAGVVSEMEALGMILPDADRGEIQRVLAIALQEVAQRGMADMSTIDVMGLARESRQLLFQLPFQIPQHVMYLGRALALLSGVITMLDPAFNMVSEARPLAVRWIQQEQRSLFADLISTGRTLLGIPTRLDRVLGQFERGTISVDTRALEHQIAELTKAQRRRDWLLIGMMVVLIAQWWMG
jgi:predicted unusual protein kinase regulating ubiquinone biosynthesis (AarF/ABC1/UbiB family)